MPRSLRTHIALAAILLAFGIGSAWWVITTGRTSLGTLTLRTLAILGLIAVGQWVVDLARTIRRHRRG